MMCLFEICFNLSNFSYPLRTPGVDLIQVVALVGASLVRVFTICSPGNRVDWVPSVQQQFTKSSQDEICMLRGETSYFFLTDLEKNLYQA